VQEWWSASRLSSAVNSVETEPAEGSRGRARQLQADVRALKAQIGWAPHGDLTRGCVSSWSTKAWFVRKSRSELFGPALGLMGIDQWLGGAIYTQNLIKALSRLPAAEARRA